MSYESEVQGVKVYTQWTSNDGLLGIFYAIGIGGLFYLQQGFDPFMK